MSRSLRYSEYRLIGAGMGIAVKKAFARRIYITNFLDYTVDGRNGVR